jgi:hypothetical protein
VGFALGRTNILWGGDCDEYWVSGVKLGG